MKDKEILFDNIGKIYTTEMGVDRIKRNLRIDTTVDVVEYCKKRYWKTIVIFIRKLKTGIARLTILELQLTHIVLPL